MIDSYINIDKSHKSFDQTFVDLGLNKLVLKNITKSNQINLVVTSLAKYGDCLLYTSPSPRDQAKSRMPSSA